MNTALYAYGDNGKQKDQTYRSVLMRDDEHHTLESLYFKNNELCGFILLGDVSKMTVLLNAVNEKQTFAEMFK